MAQEIDQQTRQDIKPDICVIGAGPGGLAAASAAAAFGVNVVLVEKGKMGGESLNCGSVPSKALLAAAAQAHVSRNGVKGARFGADFTAACDHVRAVVAAIAPQDFARASQRSRRPRAARRGAFH